MDFGDLSRAQGSLLVLFCAIFCTDQKKNRFKRFFFGRKTKKKRTFYFKYTKKSPNNAIFIVFNFVYSSFSLTNMQLK